MAEGCDGDRWQDRDFVLDNMSSAILNGVAAAVIPVPGLRLGLQDRILHRVDLADLPVHSVIV